MLILKKPGKCLELPLRLYEDGIKLIKLKLLELHPEFDSIIKIVYSEFCNKKEVNLKEFGSVIVASAPKNKLMILKDKKIFANQTILTTNWSLILGAVLISKEKDCVQFWNESCEDRSKKLWFPTEIDYVDSHSSLLNGSVYKTIQGSWFSTKMNINQEAKNSQKMSYQLSKSLPVEKWVNEGIRVIKLRLLPTPEQKRVLEKWVGTTRYVYNKCLENIKNDKEFKHTAKNYNDIRDRFITKLNNTILENDIIADKSMNSYIHKWELDTPKDIRHGAIRDIQKAYKTAFSNLKSGNLNKFGLELRRKKSGNEQSMEINKDALKIKGNKLKLYSTYIKAPIKIYKRSLRNLKLGSINKYCRLKKENDIWYLCVPIDIQSKEKNNKPKKICAIDPGVRKFNVIYSEDNVTQIIPDHNKLNKLNNKLDLLKSLRDTKVIKQQSYNRSSYHLRRKIKNLIYDLHHKTARYLVDNFTDILLPSFETQEMVSKPNLSKRTKRSMINLSFYKFQQCLVHKATLQKGCNVYIVNEAFTSQTCGNCGNLKKTSDEIINCDNCLYQFDRDINGARNIYLKYIE